MTDFHDLTGRHDVDGADHPDHALLTAFAELDDHPQPGLDGADREWIESHLLVCARCAEDVADIRDVRRQLAGSTRTTRSARWVAYGAIAAGLALMAWAGGLLRTSPQAPDTTMAEARAVDTVPRVDAQPTEDEQAVAAALSTGRVPLPPFHDIVHGQVGTLLGDPTGGAPLTPSTPIATAITSARPQFTWTAGVNVTTYEVAVFDDRFTEVAGSGPLTTLSWTPDRDLPRGRVLAWQITATGPAGSTVSPAPPQPEARFVVLSMADVAVANDARERLAEEPLALALTLARLGLYREADAAFTRAMADTRYDPAQVRRLVDAFRNR